MMNRCQFGELAWKEAGRMHAVAQDALRGNDLSAFTEAAETADRLERIRRACGSCDSAGFFFPDQRDETQRSCHLTDEQTAFLGSVAASSADPGDLEKVGKLPVHELTPDIVVVELPGAAEPAEPEIQEIIVRATEPDRNPPVL
jgi:hypothetical protein